MLASGRYAAMLETTTERQRARIMLCGLA
ncbi:hypothetical protein PanWU01x14_359050 [Parasponia andersonii]|uniref:Uncharacterized protein n=1 Tax=Parasponia andersonii TaxID=3476 RepID=A0A2P5A831_PARAD|nr:hypothetical protein PanWU01x14_359050 [Parasponia andersonii]